MQLGVDFMEGGKPREPGEKPSKYGRDQLRELYSHKSQVWESTQRCTQMFTHPATDPARPGLTWNSVVKGNTLPAYATRAPDCSDKLW